MTPEQIAAARLSGAADLELVDAVLDAIQRLYDAVEGVSSTDQMMFSLAVCEISTNIAVHARPLDEHDEVLVDVELSIDDLALAATFVDNAQPAQIALRALVLPDESRESGRGLVLVRSAVDDLSHEAARGNIWRLRRLRRPD